MPLLTYSMADEETTEQWRKQQKVNEGGTNTVTKNIYTTYIIDKKDRRSLKKKKEIREER